MSSFGKQLCVALAVLPDWAFADKVYWVDRGANTLESANRDGTGRTNIAIGTFSAGIAADSVNGHVYWSENGSDKIRRANLDLSGAADVVSPVVARGLALDVAGRKVYWVGFLTQKVKRANLDGSDVQDLVTSGGNVYEVALDLVHGKM